MLSYSKMASAWMRVQITLDMSTVTFLLPSLTTKDRVPVSGADVCWRSQFWALQIADNWDLGRPNCENFTDAANARNFVVLKA